MLTDITAAIIAGGKSTRFGSPKALARLDNRAMIEFAIRTAQKISHRVLLNYGNNLPYNAGDIPVVRDIIPDRGPLGGVYTALVHAETSWVAILPCDLPLLSSEVYHILYAGRQLNRPAMAVSHTGTEPLVSIWPVEVSGYLEILLKKGKFKLQSALQSLGAITVDIPQKMPNYRPELFLNVNQKEDLQKIRQVIEQRRDR